MQTRFISSAKKVKNSSLSTIDILTIIGTIVICTLLLIYAPEVMLAIANIAGYIGLIALAVALIYYSITYNPQCNE